jgi:hypothetical protein
MELQVVVRVRFSPENSIRRAAGTDRAAQAREAEGEFGGNRLMRSVSW